MALHNLGIKLRKVPPIIYGLSITNIGPDYATINVTLGMREGRFYAIALPDGSTAPSAAQIVAETDGSNNPISGANGWAGNGKVINIGSSSIIYMPGINNLQRGVGKIWDVYVVMQRADTTYTDVLAGTFTATNAAPLLVSTSPSHNWKLASLTANITMTFDQTITLGTGNVVLRDTDTNADVETFNVATGTGSAGGTITRSTTTVTNDTLVINPNASLTARKNYAITVASTAVKNSDASLGYAGISNYTTFAFKSNYSAGAAATILDGDEGFAWDNSDDTLQIIDAGTPANDYNSTWSGKVTITGSLAKSESGIRVTTSNYAELDLTVTPFDPTVGTLIFEVNAEDLDTDLGNNLALNFYSAPGYANWFQNGGYFVKFDTSTVNSALSVAVFKGGGSAAGVTLSAQSFPRNGFGVIGMTWNSSELAVATPTESDAVAMSSSTTPTVATKMRFGPFVDNGLYFDIRRGLYLPTKLTEAELQTRVADFLDFVSA